MTSPVSTKPDIGPASGTGSVWNVTSGDTIEVCLGVSQGKPAIKKLSLAGVIAPRLGIKSQHETKDEPMAWESKEMLRTLLLAKKVQFRSLYQNQNGDRDYCEVRLVGSEEKNHVGFKMLSLGLARIAPGEKVKNLGIYPELESAERLAQNGSLGVYSAQAGGQIRDLQNASTDFSFDYQSWFEKNKLKERKCQIEHIRDAGCYRVIVLPESEEDKTYVTAQVLLSGVQNPTFKRDKNGQEEEAQPNNGAFYARAFALERLLCREVTLRIESLQRAGTAAAQTINFIASLVHPAKGSIAEFFLEQGFAQYVDWSAQNCYSGADKLLASQKKAQDAHRGRWKNFDPSKSSVDSFEINGKVTEVVSGDVLRIVNVDSPERQELRYYLASVRAPAIVRGQYGWGDVAQEYMRKKLIGRTFKVRLDYKKNRSIFKQEGQSDSEIRGPPASDEASGDLFFVTLMDSNKQNVLFDVIKEGMIDVEQPRGAADQLSDRARDFDTMWALYEESKNAGKGHHGSAKAPTPPPIMELVLQQTQGKDAPKPSGGKMRGPATKKELVERAKGMESQLVNKKAGHDGIVRYIMNGSRMRIELVHEKLLITFQMDGVRAPNAERQGPPQSGPAANLYKPEPFGNQSLSMARELCMQQDVKVVISRCDPAGSFIGQLYTQKGNRREDVGQVLLEKGLAYTDGWSTNQVHLSAEKMAQASKIGYWSVVDPNEQQEVEKETAAGTSITGQITHINSLDDFYLVPKGGEDKKIQTSISTEVAKWEKVQKPMKRKVYAARHWEDKQWYRARYEGRGSEGEHSMFFLDSGATCDVDELKEIPRGHELANKPGVAQHCALYGIKTNDEFWEFACQNFFNKTSGKDVSGIVEKDFQGIKKVTLSVGGESLQEALIKTAYARITQKERNPTNGKYMDWKKAQEQAKNTRKNMWKYGDVGSDDENDY